MPKPDYESRIWDQLFIAAYGAKLGQPEYGKAYGYAAEQAAVAANAALEERQRHVMGWASRPSANNPFMEAGSRPAPAVKPALCPACNGKKEILGITGYRTCEACDGTGVSSV